MIPWTELQEFSALVRLGQLARVAAQMRVDATTIGRRIRRLERRLGVTLFEQTRGGHVPTEAGERLLVHVEEMQRAADRIQDMPASSDALTGTIRLSVSEGFGTWFVANMLGEFQRLHPGIALDLVASSGFLSPSRRETDLAVMLARPTTGPVVSHRLTAYELRLYAAAGHPAADGRVQTVADLGDHVLVGYIADLLYAPELRYLDEFDPGLSPTLRSSSINAQYRMIASGAGIGVLPRFIGDADPTLRPVLPAHRVERTFWLVTHRDTRDLRRIKAFADWLVAAVADRQVLFAGRD
jgi:DNA-binding transcriptional LysR family regulator